MRREVAGIDFDGAALGVAMVIALTGAGGLAVEAADIIPVSQERDVFGAASAEDQTGSYQDSDSDRANDFAPFEAAASAMVSLDGGVGSGGGSQRSTITARTVDAVGSSFATGETWETGVVADGSGRSLFDFTFDVDEQTPFTIAGMLAAYDSGGTSFLFSGPSGDVVVVPTPSNEEVVFDEQGTLEPGRYRLRFRTVGSAFGDNGFSDYAFGEFQVSFALGGTPGDVNGDGVVDFADLLDVLAAWGPCPPPCAADLNGDGVVDFADVLIVLANWSP